MDEPATAGVEKRAMFEHTQGSPVHAGGVETDAAWPKSLPGDEQEARRVPEMLRKMKLLEGKFGEAAKHLVEETVDDEDAARRRVAELFVEKTFAEHNSGHERPEQKAFDSPSTTVSEYVHVPWYEQEPNPLYYVLTRDGRAVLKDPVDKHFIQRLRETVLGQRYGADAFPDAKEQSPEARAIELVENELWNHRTLGRYDSRDRAIRALKKNLANKIFGYLARCEGKFCTTALKIKNFESKLDPNTIGPKNLKSPSSKKPKSSFSRQNSNFSSTKIMILF